MPEVYGGETVLLAVEEIRFLAPVVASRPDAVVAGFWAACSASVLTMSSGSRGRSTAA